MVLNLGPSVTSVTEVQVHDEEPYIPGGPFAFQLPEVTAYNQEFWVLAQITTANKDGMLSLQSVVNCY